MRYQIVGLFHILFGIMECDHLHQNEQRRMKYSSDRFLLEVTETTRPPLIIIDYSHFSCMSGNQIGTLFGIRNTLNFSLIRRYQY